MTAPKSMHREYPTFQVGRGEEEGAPREEPRGRELQTYLTVRSMTLKNRRSIPRWDRSGALSS